MWLCSIPSPSPIDKWRLFYLGGLLQFSDSFQEACTFPFLSWKAILPWKQVLLLVEGARPAVPAEDHFYRTAHHPLSSWPEMHQSVQPRWRKPLDWVQPRTVSYISAYLLKPLSFGLVCFPTKAIWWGEAGNLILHSTVGWVYWQVIAFHGQWQSSNREDWPRVVSLMSKGH